jgi:hypothetical protein
MTPSNSLHIMLTYSHKSAPYKYITYSATQWPLQHLTHIASTFLSATLLHGTWLNHQATYTQSAAQELLRVWWCPSVLCRIHHMILCDIYRVSQEEGTKLREGVLYVKLYRKTPKHLYPKLNGLGDNGNWKLWISFGSKNDSCQLGVLIYSYSADAAEC